MQNQTIAPGQQRFLFAFASSNAKPSNRPWPTAVFIRQQQCKIKQSSLANSGFYSPAAMPNQTIAPGRQQFLFASSNAKSNNRPWPTAVFIRQQQCKIKQSPLANSGFYSPAAMPNQTIAPGQQRFLIHCSVGRTSDVQIGSRQRGGTGVALMAMRIPSTAAIQYVRRAAAPHFKKRSWQGAGMGRYWLANSICPSAATLNVVT